MGRSRVSFTLMGRRFESLSHVGKVHNVNVLYVRRWARMHRAVRRWVKDGKPVKPPKWVDPDRDVSFTFRGVAFRHNEHLCETLGVAPECPASYDLLVAAWREWARVRECSMWPRELPFEGSRQREGLRVSTSGRENICGSGYARYSDQPLTDTTSDLEALVPEQPKNPEPEHTDEPELEDLDLD